MFNKIISIVLILILLLTFAFGYTSDGNITDDDNFIINVEKMDSWTSTLLNSFNNFITEIKTDTMNKYLDVINFISDIGETYSDIEINKISDIFNKDNIFSFFKGLMSIIIAPFYVLYSILMLLFNVIFLFAKLTLNLIITCIDIGRILS